MRVCFLALDKNLLPNKIKLQKKSFFGTICTIIIYRVQNMLSFLPGPLLFVINFILIVINTVIIATPILILALLRVLLPFKTTIKLIEKLNLFLYGIWVHNNSLTIALTNKIDWQVNSQNITKIKNSCIIICNHQSWADIVMICHIFKGKIPITKFFLKHSLIYIPLIGLACLGLGMPFLRRYSKQQLLKNPKLKNKDIESTNKACRRLIHAPSTLVNFVEGTRYTKEKADAVKSPYRHLMPPKAASLGIALGQIGKDIDVLFNTTLRYPDNEESPFIDMLKGKLKTVYANVEPIKVTDEIIGDYLGNKQFKHSFTLWLRELWERKDEELDEMYKKREQKKPAEKLTGGKNN